MRDALSLGFARSFQILSSLHVVSESVTHRVLHHQAALCFLFNVHGDLYLDLKERRLALASDEAALFAFAGAGTIALSYGNDAEFYLLQFRQGRPAEGVPRLHLEVPEHVTLRNSGRLKHLVRMFMEQARRDGVSPLVLHHLLVLMLCETARSSHRRSETQAHEDGLENMASHVDAYIAAHYHEPIGTPDIAAELRYNPDYLERAYRSDRHMSIREAIHERRIREARAQLLLQRALGVAQVAALCGYPDAGYFRRVFKRATSMTPHGYRALNASDHHGEGVALQAQ
ncbi:MAG: helix-turn-helix transcriptional regulator [Spirochaetia bacterium]